MTYHKFEELPLFLRAYIEEMVSKEAAEWVARPVPALEGKSFLEYINAVGVSKAAAYLSNVGTKYGLPHAVRIPPDFRE